MSAPLNFPSTPGRGAIRVFSRLSSWLRLVKGGKGSTIRVLRERIDEYETLLKVIPVGISVARDPECKVIVSNRHHATRLGHTPDENTSIDPRAPNPASFRIAKGGIPMTVDELPMHRAIAEGREVLNVECDVITREGQRLTLLAHAAPLLDEVGRVRGAVGAFDDITVRKNAERALASSEHLHRQLALHKARLYEEAQSALHERDRLLATVSHELRSPLSAILGWTQILKHRPRNEKQLDTALAVIERNAQRQQRLVEDLLDVSRISTGKLRLDLRDMDLAAVVREAVQSLSAMAVGSGVTLADATPPVPMRIYGDCDRLHQVVTNLVSNAIKFTPGGHVHIQVRREAGEAVLRVRDDGRGIAADFLPHVFEQFRQEARNDASSPQGLGLGLSIARHIVELHGGHIDVESEGPGKGAMFVVALPLRSPGR